MAMGPPIVFDDRIIETPLLQGELMPLVKPKNPNKPHPVLFWFACACAVGGVAGLSVHVAQSRAKPAVPLFEHATVDPDTFDGPASAQAAAATDRLGSIERAAFVWSHYIPGKAAFVSQFKAAGFEVVGEAPGAKLLARDFDGKVTIVLYVVEQQRGRLPVWAVQARLWRVAPGGP